MAGDGERTMTVSADMAGWRLDKALGRLFPELGLRRLRRVFLDSEVLAGGRPRTAAYKVRAGDEVRVVPRAGVSAPGGVPEGVRVLAAGPEYGAVAKPGGLASASIGPGGRQSLEDHLGAIFPGREVALLSRLDTATSGIVAVAFSKDAVERFRRAEDRGEAQKTYLAVVRGRVAEAFTATAALDTARRARTRVLGRDTDDPLRQTRVTPLGYDAGTDLTLVRAQIAKGARHQIRAHLAARGHPILGDGIYGNSGGEAGRLYLHHVRIIFPGLAAVCPPQWTSPGDGSFLDLGPGVEQALDDVVLAYEVGP